MNNFMDFCGYFNNQNNNKSEFNEIAAYKNMYNAYSSYLVARKYNLEDIRKYRMNSLIDYFIQINKLPDNSREEFRKYYLAYIKDDFNVTLNPPRCPFYEEEKAKREEAERQRIEDENDDIKEHYRQLDCRYKFFAELVHRLNNPQLYEYNENDENLLYDDDLSTSDSNESYEEYSSYEYDDDQYDGYDNEDYMSDDEYYM
jgi:hypothetical protein